MAILGLAFKPGTEETAGSAGLWLLETLRAAGFAVFVHDPAVRLTEAGNVRQAAEATDCIASAGLVVIATPWREYRNLDAQVFEHKRVIDCWDMLSDSQKNACESYRAMGAGPC